MNPIVTKEEKKLFLSWFLKRYQLQVRESAWLLTYLMSDETLLENLHFVQEWQPTQRFMKMSTTCAAHTDIAFYFHKGSFTTTDVERAFHDIRLNPDDQTFLWLVFHEADRCPQYASVQEAGLNKKTNRFRHSMYSLLAEMVMDEALENAERKRLKEEIDQSLLEKDKERFMLLTHRLQRLNKEE